MKAGALPQGPRRQGKAAAKTAAKQATKQAGKAAAKKAAAVAAANPYVWVAAALAAALAALMIFALMLAGSAASVAAADCNSQDQGAGLDAAGGGEWVGFSVYGGPADPSSGVTGYRGDNLELHPNSFAELSNNPAAGLANLDYAALGKLPYLARLRVTGPKGSLVLRKRDVGGGGPPVGVPPTKRAIDIWYTAAQRLGISGVGRVQVERVDAGAQENAGDGAQDGGAGAKIKFPLPLASTERPDGGYGRASAVKGTNFLEGVELMAAEGTPASSPVSGRVARAGWLDEYGYFVAIKDGQVTYVLARLRRAPSISRDARVAAGEVVGEVGKTGGARRGAKLNMQPHLEVRMYDPQHTLGDPVRSSGAINPTKYLQGAYDGSGADADTLDTAGSCTGDAAPSGGDGSVSAIITWANWVEKQRFPYCWGGGHVDPARPTSGSYCWTENETKVAGGGPGLDCSGAVSFVLQHAGIKVPTMVSTGFSSWGDPGPGRRVTIYSNAAHVLMVIDGKTWQTSQSNYRHGPGWTAPRGDIASFTATHPPGL